MGFSKASERGLTLHVDCPRARRALSVDWHDLHVTSLSSSPTRRKPIRPSFTLTPARPRAPARSDRSKANSYIKLHKKGGNILGIKGFFNRMGETTKTLKEGWSFLSVGLEVSRSMQEFEKRQEKGEVVSEEEMKRMEEDMSGKMLLVAWKGSKFELSNVLRQVVDAGESYPPPSPSVFLLLGASLTKPPAHSPHQGIPRSNRRDSHAPRQGHLFDGGHFESGAT